MKTVLGGEIYSTECIYERKKKIQVTNIRDKKRGHCWYCCGH